MSNFAPKIILVLLALTLLMCKGKVDDAEISKDVLKIIRTHDFPSAVAILNASPDTQLINELKNYQKLITSYGIYKGDQKPTKPKIIKGKPIVIALNKLNIGLYGMLHNLDSLDVAFHQLHEGLEISKKLNNNSLTCEILKCILLNYYDKSLTTISKSALIKYLKEYKNHAYDTLEQNIYRFLEIHLKMIYLTNETYFLEQQELTDLEFLSQHLTNDYFKGRALMTLGIYHENHFKDYEKSLFYYTKAKNIFSKYQQHVYLERFIASLINKARTIREQGFYQKCINSIKKVQLIRAPYHGKPIQWLAMFEYRSLDISYSKLDMGKIAETYDKNYRSLRNKFKQSTQDAHVVEKQIKLNVEKYKKENMNLTTILSIVLPILAIIALIAIALFYYFKKYKSKSKSLETEKSETLEKIEELKKIVIKNHIVLKDKTKVYIADLMYVKSEDHFIKLFLSNGKSHFVRGKISQIAEELPPNFIRSHRSYIINSNFIKQINSNHIILLDKTEIPLSRGHKNNFKDKP